MRYEATATCLSWIPPTAVEGVFGLPFGLVSSDYRQHDLPEGAWLRERPIADTEIHLLLDGLLLIEIDQQAALEVGPEAIFDPATRTQYSKEHATVRALTPGRLAVLPPVTSSTARPCLTAPPSKHPA